MEMIATMNATIHDVLKHSLTIARYLCIYFDLLFEPLVCSLHMFVDEVFGKAMDIMDSVYVGMENLDTH